MPLPYDGLILVFPLKQVYETPEGFDFYCCKSWMALTEDFHVRPCHISKISNRFYYFSMQSNITVSVGPHHHYSCALVVFISADALRDHHGVVIT